MGQVLHIFRKDLRHFWPEAALVSLLSFAFAWIFSNGFPPGGPHPLSGFYLTDRQWEILTYLVATLLPVSWFVLIARGVHAENLVGDEQFWFTRPYQWTSLLIAKLCLFLFAILIPFMLAQLFLFHAAGLMTFFTWSAFAYGALNIFAVALLPFFAFAAVISSLVRMVGVLLAVSIAVLTFAFVASTFHTNPAPDIYVPHHDVLGLPAIMLLCMACLLVQYKFRKLWLSRLILLLAPLTLAFLAVFPYEKTSFNSFYPERSAAQSHLRLGLERSFLLPELDGKSILGNLILDIDFDGLARGTALSTDNARLTISAPDGTDAQTSWRSVSSPKRILAPSGRTTLDLEVPRSFLQKH